MESPRQYLERRSGEVDRDLAACVNGLAHRQDAAEFVRDHPFAALGCGAAAGFLAVRLLATPAGKAIRHHLLRSTAGLAALAMRHHTPPPPAPPEPGPEARAAANAGVPADRTVPADQDIPADQDVAAG